MPTLSRNTGISVAKAIFAGIMFAKSETTIKPTADKNFLDLVKESCFITASKFTNHYKYNLL